MGGVMKLKKNQPRFKVLGLILVLIGIFVVSLVWMKRLRTEQLNARPFYQKFEEAVALMRSTDVRVGSGQEAKRGARVTLHYVGKLKDGSVFDSSRARNQPVVFELGAAKALPCFDHGVIVSPQTHCVALDVRFDELLNDSIRLVLALGVLAIR
jgi:hypothetical protein